MTTINALVKCIIIETLMIIQQQKVGHTHINPRSARRLYAPV